MRKFIASLIRLAGPRSDAAALLWLRFKRTALRRERRRLQIEREWIARAERVSVDDFREVTMLIDAIERRQRARKFDKRFPATRSES